MATTTNLSTLKINYLTQEQYNTAVANNQINSDELYFTPSQITYGTTDLVAGSSALTTGTIYLVYE